ADISLSTRPEVVIVFREFFRDFVKCYQGKSVSKMCSFKFPNGLLEERK
ncbi:unnamed protein product, partial [Callosobruchus maculatus]